MQDATVLLRDMASDSAQRAAGVLRPSEEQLAQMDKPAEDNVWHEKPNISKDAIKSRKKSKKQKAQDQSMVNGLPADQLPTNQLPVSQQQGGLDAPVASTSTSAPAPATGTPAEAEAKDKAKQKSRDYTDKTKAFLAEKMPQERREQTIWRVKKMIVEIQGHSDCE